MPEMLIRQYSADNENAMVELWQRCGLTRPWNDPRKDIARKLKVNPELFLVGFVNGKVAASAVAGYEGHRGWVNYLAVDPDFQRKGLGRQMMQNVEQALAQTGCPKVNIQVRTGNLNAIEFYKNLGYKIDETASMGKRLEEDI